MRTVCQFKTIVFWEDGTKLFGQIIEFAKFLDGMEWIFGSKEWHKREEMHLKEKQIYLLVSWN